MTILPMYWCWHFHYKIQDHCASSVFNHIQTLFRVSRYIGSSFRCLLWKKPGTRSGLLRLVFHRFRQLRGSSASTTQHNWFLAKRIKWINAREPVSSLPQYDETVWAKGGYRVHSHFTCALSAFIPPLARAVSKSKWIQGIQEKDSYWLILNEGYWTVNGEK